MEVETIEETVPSEEYILENSISVQDEVGHDHVKTCFQINFTENDDDEDTATAKLLINKIIQDIENVEIKSTTSGESLEIIFSRAQSQQFLDECASIGTQTDYFNDRIRYTSTLAQDNKAVMAILKGTPVHKSHVALCNDKIKLFYKRSRSITGAIGQAISFLQDGIDDIMFDDLNSINNISWFQLIYRSLEVWDINAVSKTAKRKFLLINQKLALKSEELEDGITNILELLQNKRHTMGQFNGILRLSNRIKKLRKDLEPMMKKEHKHAHGSDEDETKTTSIGLKKNLAPEVLITFSGPEMEISCKYNNHGHGAKHHIRTMGFDRRTSLFENVNDKDKLQIIIEEDENSKSPILLPDAHPGTDDDKGESSSNDNDKNNEKTSSNEETEPDPELGPGSGPGSLGVNVKVNLNEKTLLLKQFPELLQAELINIPLLQLIRIIDKVLVNVSAATEILTEKMSINELKEALFPNLPLSLKSLKFRPLESVIIAIISKTIDHKISKILNTVMKIEDSIGNFTRMVYFLQINSAGKKLVAQKLNESEIHQLKSFREVIEKLPQEFRIHGIMAKNAYSYIIDKAWTSIHSPVALPYMDQNVQRSLYDDDDDEIALRMFKPQYIPPKEKVHVPIKFPRLRSFILAESGQLHDLHVEHLIKLLYYEYGENLVAGSLLNGYRILLCPKASQRKGKHTSESQRLGGNSPLGFMEGISFLMKEMFENLIETTDSSNLPPLPKKQLKWKLDQLVRLILKFEELGKRLEEILKSLHISIMGYKKKLPSDMSFLDNEIEELHQLPHLSEITLHVWKQWELSHPQSSPEIPNLPHDDGDDYDAPQEMEIRWDSGAKNEIFMRSSSHSFRWIRLSTMGKFSKVQAIMTLMDSAFIAIQRSYSQMISAEMDVGKSKRMLKLIGSKVSRDEKMNIISPSNAYVFFKYFEDYSLTAAAYLKSIGTILTAFKLSLGKAQGYFLPKKFKSKSQNTFNRRRRRYPESLLINVLIDAPQDIEDWLQADEFQNGDGDGEGDGMSVIEIKSPIGVHYSLTSMQSIKEVDDGVEVEKEDDEVTNSETMRSNTSELSDQQQEHHLSSSSSLRRRYQFQGIKNPIEKKILLELQPLVHRIPHELLITNNFLLNPNVSLEESIRLQHFNGILCLLACTALDFPLSRLSTNYRNRLQELIRSVTKVLKKLIKPKEFPINETLSKMLEYCSSIKEVLGDEEDIATAFDGITIMRSSLSLPPLAIADDESQSQRLSQSDGLGRNANGVMTETNEALLAEHVANKTKTSVWSITCRLETGISLRSGDSKTIYLFSQLRIQEQLQFFSSIIQYINEIGIITDKNMTKCKKRLLTSKNILKHYTKKVPYWIKKGKLGEGSIDLMSELVRDIKGSCALAKGSFDKLQNTMAQGIQLLELLLAYLQLQFKLQSAHIPRSESLIRVKEQYRLRLGIELAEFHTELELFRGFPLMIEIPLSLATSETGSQ